VLADNCCCCCCCCFRFVNNCFFAELESVAELLGYFIVLALLGLLVVLFFSGTKELGMLLEFAIELIGLDLLLLLVKLLLIPYEGAIELLAPPEPGSSLTLKLLKKSGYFG